MTVVEPSGRVPAQATLEPRSPERSEGSPGSRRNWVLTAVLLVTDTLMVALALFTHKRRIWMSEETD